MRDRSRNSKGIEVASAEKHREWMCGYTLKSWREGRYKEFSQLGSICDPTKKYGLPAKYFTGASNVIIRKNGSGIEVASDEQHREWIQKERCTFHEWSGGIYKKYAHLGAIANPYYSVRKKATCKRKWSWFSGDLIKGHDIKRGGRDRIKRASAEKHREWISTNGYSVLEWKEVYRDYPGAVARPQMTFGKSWSWFRDYVEVVYVVDIKSNTYKELSLREYREYGRKIGVKPRYLCDNVFIALIRRGEVNKRYKIGNDLYLITDKNYLKKCTKNYYWVKDESNRFVKGCSSFAELCSFLGEKNEHKVRGAIGNGSKVRGKSVMVRRQLCKEKFT